MDEDDSGDEWFKENSLPSNKNRTSHPNLICLYFFAHAQPVLAVCAVLLGYQFLSIKPIIEKGINGLKD